MSTRRKQALDLAKKLSGANIYFDSPYGEFAFVSRKGELAALQAKGVAAFSPLEAAAYLEAVDAGLVDDDARRTIIEWKRAFGATVKEIVSCSQATSTVATTKRARRTSTESSAKAVASATSARESAVQIPLLKRRGR